MTPWLPWKSDGSAKATPIRDEVLATYSCRIEKQHPNSEWRRDIVYPEKGLRIEVRPMTPDDDQREADFFEAQTLQERTRRFLGLQKTLRQDQIRRLTHLDFSRHFAIVAVDRATDSLAGVARYCRLQSDAAVAELGVAVLQRYQRLGLGSYLLAAVFDAARKEGIATLRAEMLKGNTASLRMAEKVGKRAGATQHLDRSDPDLDTLSFSLAARPHHKADAKKYERRDGKDLSPPVEFKVDDRRHPKSRWRHDLVFPSGLRIEVRPADIDDRQRITLFAKGFADAGVKEPAPCTAARELFDFTTGFTLVAIDMALDTIVGVAHFHRGTDWSCLNVLMAPSHRGLGISDFLTEVVLSAARSDVLEPLHAAL